MTIPTDCGKAGKGRLRSAENKPSAASFSLRSSKAACNWPCPACTTIKVQQDLDISADILNVNGGVIALGHPMGATGAMMAGTLLDELERRTLDSGVVAASGAAGSGSALLLRRC